MARYIDADELKKEINDLSPYPNCEWSGWGVLSAIDRQETVDVRPERHKSWKGFVDSAYYQAKEQYEVLWNSTVKKSDLDKYGWETNPWVWVIEFERLVIET